MKLKIILGLTLAVVLTWSQRAEACGCFAPPNTAEPIVQAGERILFAVRNGKVIAHIQIQYAGEAKDFGWLLPLPSVPTLKVGSDELFAQLNATTQPVYLTQTSSGASCASARPIFACGCASPLSSGGVDDLGTNPRNSPLVVSASVGPYEYAVLRADDKTEMLQWLSDNRYFVPTGTQNAVDPYIHAGAYFLALKLKAGASTGDVTPVTLEYPAELPMIPIILTSVGATPNMGVQVFMLGNGRGIPRNYHHVVLNDALLNWTDVSNYTALVTQAVSEAPKKHAFVTEYAATSSVMRDVLVPPGRFGDEQALSAAMTPRAFVDTLLRNGFANSDSSGRLILPSPVIRLLLTDIPYPAGLANLGVNENGFLTNLEYYLGNYRADNPMVFNGYMLDFDAPSLARQIFAEYVTPLKETNELFAEFPRLTRLFTTLSPEDMTEDPVFSFNPSLPAITGKHDANRVNDCPSGQTLMTEQGWIIEGGATPSMEGPAALRVEVLAEEGPPTVVVDNKDLIHERFRLITDATMPANGCSAVDPMSLGLLVVMWLRRRRSA